MSPATNGGPPAGPQAEVYQAARQDKPWGHEIIFAAVEGKYVGKVIHVTAGQFPQPAVSPAEGRDDQRPVRGRAD